MTKENEYKVAIVIGRMQGVHNGHAALLKHARKVGEKVLVMLGSSNAPIGFKNPWSFEERQKLVDRVMWNEVSHGSYKIKPLPDFSEDEMWFSEVRKNLAEAYPDIDDSDVCIVGHMKDDSSWYLKAFPEWDLVSIESHGNISATDIRKDYFRDAPRIPFGIVPESVSDFMQEWWTSPEFAYVLGETKWLEQYRKDWGTGPFVTVDNVVTHSGKVLLVLRSDYPAKGKWALPGGFVEPAKGDSFDNAVAELFEETTLSDSRGRVPQGILKNFYKDRIGKRFDDPNRSIRGYTLTTAFRVILPSSKKFSVKGDDDALDAKWFNISDLKEEDLMEDHYQIIMEMV